MVASTQEPSNAAVAWAGGNDSSSTVYNMGSIPMGPGTTYHLWITIIVMEEAYVV